MRLHYTGQPTWTLSKLYAYRSYTVSLPTYPQDFTPLTFSTHYPPLHQLPLSSDLLATMLTSNLQQNSGHDFQFDDFHASTDDIDVSLQ